MNRTRKNCLQVALLLSLCLAGCVRPRDADSVNPPPNVVVDEGRYGLAAVSASGMRRVTGATRKDEAGVIAQAHLDAAAEARKSPYYLVHDMQTAVAEKISQHLTPARRAAWKPWQDAISDRIKELEAKPVGDKQQLVGREDWIQAYEEIAAPLKGGKS